MTNVINLTSTFSSTHHQERALYYEPGSGTYYYYDHDVQTYKFHSQVDLAQYTGTTDSQYQDHNQQHTHTPGKRKPAKKKEKDKDRKTGGTKVSFANPIGFFHV